MKELWNRFGLSENQFQTDKLVSKEIEKDARLRKNVQQKFTNFIFCFGK
jgi:hypothetical protein